MQSPLGLYFSFLKKYRGMSVPIVLSVILETAFTAGIPYSFSIIVDKALLGNDRRLLLYVVSGLMIGVVIVTVLGIVRDRLYARLTAGVMNDIRTEMFAHLQRLSIAYYSRNQVGDILARFSSDLAVVEHATWGAITWAVLPGLEVVASTALLFMLNWKLALIAMFVWPLAATGPRIFAPKVAEESYKRKKEEAQILSYLQENVNAQSLIKTFGLADYAGSGFLARVTTLQSRMIRVKLFSGLVERSAYVGIMFLQVALLGVGAFMVSEDALTVGELAAFQALFLNLSYSIAYVMQFAPTLVEAGGGMRRIQELLQEEPGVPDSGKIPIPRLSREITFQNASFGYVSGHLNLKQVSFSIRKGTTVAFVGSSGSGKSTILSLVMRLYDPSEGAICIDGLDLRQATQQSLRGQMSYVPQESFLFNISIRENIRLGNMKATDAQVEQAAKAAEIHDIVLKMPQRYDTLVGERGGRLSGGQRQRIALARAILRKPEILILDEATSALDPATESAVNETIERMAKGCTILSVTHRLSSIIKVDRIFVLDAGHVCEQGTHQELLAAQGLYRKLWEKQNGLTLADDGRRAMVTPERLRQVPIFSEVPDELLAAAVQFMGTEQYPTGRVVVQEGDMGNRMFIIVRGKVEVVRDSEQGPLRSAVLEAGDYFGEIALLRAVPRTATVRTLLPSVFLTINRTEFDLLMERAPGLRMRLEKTAQQRTTWTGTLPERESELEASAQLAGE